jgi:hypothetical protein
VSTAESPGPLVVRLRPNGHYVAVLLLGAVLLAYGVMTGGLLGAVIAAGGGIWLTALGYPVVLSTLCRVPIIVADDGGIRFPLMGPAVAWPDVASVTRGAHTLSSPVLQVYPADAQAAIRQVRPWLRREARRNLARYGTPFVLSGLSMDKSLDDIAAAITRRLPSEMNAPRLPCRTAVPDLALLERRSPDLARGPLLAASAMRR